MKTFKYIVHDAPNIQWEFFQFLTLGETGWISPCLHVTCLLHDISTLGNPELVACRETLLETATVYETTFLEDVLNVTNTLSMLLTSEKRTFLKYHVL